jgi:hypothetical protein
MCRREQSDEEHVKKEHVKTDNHGRDVVCCHVLESVHRDLLPGFPGGIGDLPKSRSHQSSLCQ